MIESVEANNFVMSIGCANVIQGRCDRLVQIVKQDMVDHASRYVPEYAEALENVMERLTEKSKYMCSGCGLIVGVVDSLSSPPSSP